MRENSRPQTLNERRPDFSPSLHQSRFLSLALNKSAISNLSLPNTSPKPLYFRSLSLDGEWMASCNFRISPSGWRAAISEPHYFRSLSLDGELRFQISSSGWRAAILDLLFQICLPAMVFQIFHGILMVFSDLLADDGISDLLAGDGILPGNGEYSQNSMVFQICDFSLTLSISLSLSRFLSLPISISPCFFLSLSVSLSLCLSISPPYHKLGKIQRLTVWSLSVGKLLRTVVLPSILRTVALDPGDSIFYAGCKDSKIYIVALNAVGEG